MIQISPETKKQFLSLDNQSPVELVDWNELSQKKEQGLLPNWETITPEQLKEILINYNPTNSFLAELFDVTKGQISYRRKKWQLTMFDIIYERSMQSFAENGALQELLLQDLKNADTAVLSRAIVHYIFRKGPVEDMHVDGKFSQADMKTLNQYMMDRVATLITLFKKKDYMRLLLFLEAFQHYGSDWDDPKLQIDELDKFSNYNIRPNSSKPISDE